MKVIVPWGERKIENSFIKEFIKLRMGFQRPGFEAHMVLGSPMAVSHCDGLTKAKK
jgi:hypothetical protein